MSSSEVQQKPKTGSAAQIIVLDKAFKLAEQWVNNMSKAVEDEPRNVEPESRPARLGLGAKVARQSEVQLSNDPVERKLHAKLQARKRKVANGNQSVKDERDDENDDSDEELESRTSAFTKKRPGPPAPFTSTSLNKKQK